MEFSFPILSSSILAGNHANLLQSIRYIQNTQLSWVHLDIMDGHFTSNLTFGPQTLKDLRTATSDLFFDTHLMLNDPNLYIRPFFESGASSITIHVELKNYNIKETLKKINSLGMQSGIAINPNTPVEELKPFLKYVDIILIMTVNPGFGGQKFQINTLKKIQKIAEWKEKNHFKYHISIDGGINLEIISYCIKFNVDIFVVGTAFFKAKDKVAFVKSFNELIKKPINPL